MSIPNIITEIKQCFTLKMTDNGTPYVVCNEYRLGKVLELQQLDCEMSVLRTRAERLKHIIDNGGVA